MNLLLEKAGTLLATKLATLKKEKDALAVMVATEASLERELSTLAQTIKNQSAEYEAHQMASAFLKELIRVVSTENIEKVERLVNSAICQIFPESQLAFRITTSIKRNLTEYDFQLCRGHNKEKAGGLDSNGGGVWSLIAFILQMTFLVLSKRYPLLFLDESIVAISEKHSTLASQLIRDLAEEFNTTIVLITHQSLFIEGADSVFTLTRGKDRTVITKTR